MDHLFYIHTKRGPSLDPLLRIKRSRGRESEIRLGKCKNLNIKPTWRHSLRRRSSDSKDSVTLILSEHIREGWDTVSLPFRRLFSFYLLLCISVSRRIDRAILRIFECLDKFRTFSIGGTSPRDRTCWIAAELCSLARCIVRYHFYFLALAICIRVICESSNSDNVRANRKWKGKNASN
jgi:hypothetical protein